MIDILSKKPAFFPSVSAEVFFEAEAHDDAQDIKLETLSSELDAELAALLGIEA